MKSLDSSTDQEGPCGSKMSIYAVIEHRDTNAYALLHLANKSSVVNLTLHIHTNTISGTYLDYVGVSSIESLRKLCSILWLCSGAMSAATKSQWWKKSTITGRFKNCWNSINSYLNLPCRPIVAAMDAPPDLLRNSGGVFDGSYADMHHTRICDDPNKGLNGWQFTNHAAVIVGWGEL